MKVDFSNISCTDSRSRGLNCVWNVRQSNVNRIITGSICLAISGYVIYIFWSNFYDTSLDNSGLSINLQDTMDYFVDRDKYTYLKNLHLYAFITFGVTAMIGAEVTTLLFANYACALFHVVW